MSQVQQFHFGLMDLRVLEREGQPWFVAVDVCTALGLQGFASKHTARLLSDNA
ncbi:hypothetical protein [Pseudomonas sp. EA_35y_Pfl2_R5]|uniref:hypothetical protein n=1 Tax=Pseudomonas sp. EA_35y_Pfl2_R5 TaxID=3088690 RepID=UPI0030DA9930